MVVAMSSLESDMSYIVLYQLADGSSGVEECRDLDLAIVAAERLRNVDSVDRPRIFMAEEIAYDFRPYYRVEVLPGSQRWVEPTDAPAAEAAPAEGEGWTSHSDSPAEDGMPAAEVVETEADAATDAADAADVAMDAQEQPLVEEAAEVVEPDSTHEVFEVTPEPDENDLPVSEEVVEETAGHSAGKRPASSAAGLFSGTYKPGDPISETAKAEEVADEVVEAPDTAPPRRGLFGR